HDPRNARARDGGDRRADLPRAGAGRKLGCPGRNRRRGDVALPSLSAVPWFLGAAVLKCPGCRATDNHVVDSRLGKDGEVIRRRRRRFTTYERIEEWLPLVVKKDGRREPFDRNKVLAGMRKACEKRPVSIEMIEQTADRIEHGLLERGEREVASSVIGEAMCAA